MGKTRSFLRKGHGVLCKLSCPIVNNLPLFLMSFLLLSVETLKNLHGLMASSEAEGAYLHFLCRFGIIFVYSYIITTIVFVVSKKWLKIVVYMLLIFLFSIELFLEETFHLILSPSIFVFLSETNEGESSEFVRTFLLSTSNIKTIAIIIAAIGFVILTELGYNKYVSPTVKNKLRTSLPLSFIFVLLLIFGAFSFKPFVELFESDQIDSIPDWTVKSQYPKDPISLLIYSYHCINVMSKEQEAFIKTTLNADRKITSIYQDSLNLVFVIGESYIKSHSHIYGYELNTTSHLSKEMESGHLFPFNDVVSSYNFTSSSIKNILSTNSISDGETWGKSPYFPTLFHMAGYDVYFWDNQKTYAINTNCTFNLNGFLYNKVLNRLTYTCLNENGYAYDDGMINSFNIEKMSNKQNLIIFHLMGQHVDAAERFPHNKEFLHFTTDSIKRNEPYMNEEKKQSIADYDNATFYNDYVMNMIIDKFRNSNTVLVYFSDHGDEVYDYRNSKGRIDDNMSKGQVKYQFEIPFMIWCSDKFMEKYPEKVNLIRKSVNRPFMTDNVCHMMFNLGGIRTRYYHADRDLISPAFKPRKRIINNNYNYDEIMNTK